MNLAKTAFRVSLIAAIWGVYSLSLSGNTLAALEVEQQGPVLFISGGVGEEELQQIEKMRADYPLQLVFAARGTPNEYLAKVEVQIKDKYGKTVLDAVSQGPYLLAKVPPGKYSVSADHEGTIKRQTIQVTGAKPQRAVFVW